MTVTSVDLDKDLVKDVQAITGAPTQKAAITQALQEVRRRAQQRQSIEDLIALPVDHTPHVIDYPIPSQQADDHGKPRSA